MAKNEPARCPGLTVSLWQIWEWNPGSWPQLKIYPLDRATSSLGASRNTSSWKCLAAGCRDEDSVFLSESRRGAGQG